MARKNLKRLLASLVLRYVPLSFISSFTYCGLILTLLGQKTAEDADEDEEAEKPKKAPARKPKAKVRANYFRISLN